jgi:hypothetical protein
MNNFKEYINEKKYNKQYEEEGQAIADILEKELRGAMACDFYPNIGVVIEFEGIEENEWFPAEDAFLDISDDYDYNWKIDSIGYKELNAYASFSQIDFSISSKRDIVDNGSICVVTNDYLKSKGVHKPKTQIFDDLESLKRFVGNYNGEFIEGKIKLSI